MSANVLNLYERRMSMGKKENKKTNSKKGAVSSEATEKSKLDIKGILVQLFISCVPCVVAFAINWYTNTSVLEAEMKNISHDIEQLTTTVSEMSKSDTEMIKQISSLQSEYAGMKDRISRLENVNDTLVIKGIAGTGFTLQNDITTEIITISQPVWMSNQVIAVDVLTRKEYTAEELEDKKMLLYYEEADQNIYFYGQFNDKNHWDGECLINTYSDGKLTLIMQANYDDGRLLSYEQVKPYVTKRQQEVWAIANRTVEGDKNLGDSWNFKKEQDITEDFAEYSVQLSDMISVQQFKEEYAKEIEAYYHGATSDGKYNDTSGDAFLIKFADDGSVRMLYVGNFVDGYCDDKTGNAWDIAKEEDTDYMRYKGVFSKGQKEKGNGPGFDPEVTREEFPKYLEGYDFNMELYWNIDGELVKFTNIYTNI